MEDDFKEIPGRILRKLKFKTNSDPEARERQGLMRIADVVSRPIEWLWAPYIPFGRITMLGGDPGAGKSFITAALAATLSRGEMLPGLEDTGEEIEPMNILMLAIEDDPADTLKPRLQTLRANLQRIFFSTEDIILDGQGLSAIREMIRDTKARLVILDPIVAFLGPKMDMNRANEVRHIMKGLAKIAKEENVAVLVVRHNRKEMANNTGKAIYSGMGSIDFTASVRSELAVNEAKNGMKFLNHIKANSGPKGQSITYSITSAADGSPIFQWGDFTTWPPATAGSRIVLSRRFKGDAVIRYWLHDMLKDCPDGVPAKIIYEVGKTKGYSATKLDHVKKGVAISEKRGNGWYWRLDPTSKLAQDDDAE